MGTAMGHYHMSVGFATLVASPVAGLLWDKFGPQAAFAYGAALAIVACIMLCMLRPERSPDL
jgi:predicted MFS family arabinose efflux permease